VGLNIIQGAAIAGAHPIIAIDRVAEKLVLARALGATHGVNAAEQEVEGAVERICRGGAEYTFEALGTPATIELAVRLTGRGGTTVLVGMAPPQAPVHLDALSLTVQERMIRGCWYGSCRPLVDIPALVDLYRAGKLRLDALISVTCGLDEINEAFTRMDRGEGARTIIVYD
jgi:Zn-dependent alcohol dehydrogenase